MALDEPRRDDADDSRVPSLPGDHQRCRVKLGGAGRVGREEDALLGLATVAVEVVELLGDLGGALAVVGQHQLEGGVGAAEAAGGVDARSQAEARALGIHVGRVERRDAHQRPQARPLGAGQLGQPLPGDATVLAPQRHHVAHRRQAREVEILLGVPPSRRSAQRLRQLEHHTGRAQLRRGLRAQPGMDDRAVGQPLGGAMVIGDHHLQPEPPGRRHLVHGGDPAVHGDQQAGSGARELAHRALREPVPLVATGQPPDRVGAERAQGADHHRRGADPVHVVVPEHRHPRAGFRVAEDHGGGRVRAREGRGVRPVGGGQEPPGARGVAEAAPCEHGSGGRTHAERVGYLDGCPHRVRLTGPSAIRLHFPMVLCRGDGTGRFGPLAFRAYILS